MCKLLLKKLQSRHGKYEVSIIGAEYLIYDTATKTVYAGKVL